MVDYVNFDPAAFSVQELVGAARGASQAVPAQIAPVLIRAKLAAEAEGILVQLATDGFLDPRVRQVAVRELAGFEGAQPALRRLTTATDPLVSAAAIAALGDEYSAD